MPPQPTRASTKTKAEQEAQHKALRRAEQANILAGVRPVLEAEEQLLAFGRARIAGGWRGKLNVGPEAFFAPYANVALTERRFIVQHVHHSSGKPSEMLPHSYAMGAISRATFTDIETFGGEPACRLILHLQNGLYVRLRLRGQLNFAAAQNMVELFDSLTLAQRTVPVSPLHTTCANCSQILDQDYKFCPFCGTAQASASGITLATDEQETGNREQETEVSFTYPAQETDFAYERGDQPAEFGIALPLPDVEQPEAEAEPAPEEEVTPPETGITTAETSDVEDSVAPNGQEDVLEGVAPENFADAGLVTPESDNALGEPQQPTTAIAETDISQMEGKRQTLEPDDLTTMDYPLAAEFDTTEPMPTTATVSEVGANVEFGQYEAQDYAEFPFSETNAAQMDEGQTAALNVAAEGSDIVRDDISEAFLPHSSNEGESGGTAEATAEHADEHHDSFADATPHATGDENIDFNVPTADSEGAGNQPPVTTDPTHNAQASTHNSENQP